MKLVRDKIKLNKNLLVFGALIILVFATIFWSPKKNNIPILSGDNIIIEFRDDGFYPSDIAVMKGSTVIFKNLSQNNFWPASNLHPSHDIYPEFDSLQAISPRGEWKFKFNKAGNWRFHDHLNASFIGSIIVLEEGEDVSDADIDCENKTLDEGEKTICFEDYIRKISKDDGILAGLQALDTLFKADSFFAQNCHAFAHIVGEEAYLKFSTDDDFEADEKTTYCGYGFYHGFMEKLFSLENDLEKAKEFCSYLDETILSGRGDAKLACYHGIGHGFVDGSDKKAWGDERALIGPALKLCDQIISNEIEGYRCYSGVFNSLSIAYSSELYGLKLNKDDPLWICKEQEDKYKMGCYTDMMVALMTLEDNDFLKSSKHLIGVEEPYLSRSMYTLIGFVARDNINDDNFDFVIKDCHLLSDNLSIQCVKGFAGGLMEFGEPKKEYIKAADFCDSDGLSSNERLECYDSIIDYAGFSYPPDKLKKACELIPSFLKSNRSTINCNKYSN